MLPESRNLFDILGEVLAGVVAMVAALFPQPDVPSRGPASIGAPLVMTVGTELWDVAPEQIAAISTGIAPYTSRPRVTIRFTASGSARMATITRDNIGQVMDLDVCGANVMSPVIQTEIAGGSVVISGNFTHAEVTHLVDALTGTISCTEFLSEGAFDAD